MNYFIVVIICSTLFVSPFWITGAFFYSNGYSEHYGGGRNNSIFKGNITRFEETYDRGRYSVCMSFIEFNHQVNCRLNGYMTYSFEYIDNHYKVGDLIDLYVDAAKKPYCSDKYLANKNSRIGFILLIFSLCLIIVISFISIVGDLNIKKQQIKSNLELVPQAELETTRNTSFV